MDGVFPEFSTGGSFPKCWKREEDGICLYKGGSDAATEPYCEALASELAELICPGSVHYDLYKLDGKIATRCKLFTDESEGYVPYSLLTDTGHDLNSMLSFYAEIGSENEFRRMIVLDSVIFNEDRHSWNHGVIVDNRTTKIKRMAPVYDLNLSLLHGYRKDRFQNAKNYMKLIGPQISDDFTAAAKSVMSDSIRADLVSLKGFKFSFRGDDVFGKSRVEELERMVNRQIDILV